MNPRNRPADEWMAERTWHEEIGCATNPPVFGSQFLRPLPGPASSDAGRRRLRPALPSHLSRIAIGGLLLFYLATGTGVASASSEAVTPYTLKQTFSAALRYLRVERGFEVVERDSEAAYLLFKYQEAGISKRVVDAAVEVVELDAGVRLIVSIPAMPAFHERLLRDALLKKLASDYGPPPPAKPKPSPTKKAPPSGGKSDADRPRENPPD